MSLLEFYFASILTGLSVFLLPGFAEKPVEIACNECDCGQAAESWVKPNDIHSFSYTPCALVCCRNFGLCFTSRDCPKKDHICFIVTDSFSREMGNERRRPKARFSKKRGLTRDQEYCGKPTRCRCGPPTDISPHKNKTLTIGCPHGCRKDEKCLYQNEDIDFKCYYCTVNSCYVSHVISVVNASLLVDL
ncbi:hypothetical protein DdX_12259 [Ditylenchus destructor]|uniref:Uncharacterized protein n=1 Tax=Ditylenchus destructor TaxID=166010 RepID=A0AAD4N0P7_9BILA|nr:hypothetical protein DdX_12259 [Ditylenchus destructor]